MTAVDAAAAQAGVENDLFGGMTPIMQKQVQALVAASHGKVRLVSGYRSPQQQQALVDQAGKLYGAANTQQWAANPADSNHTQGQAADFAGDLTVLHQLAPQFGLQAPMSWEPWHLEMPSTTESASPNAYTLPPAGEVNPVTKIQTAKTPQQMAATISESLQALQHQQNSITTAEQTLDQTNAPAAQPTGGGQAANVPYTPGGGGAFGGVPQSKWATDFLTALGAPITSENMKAITAWEAAESGGGGGHFNPLNTTEIEPGNTAYNSNGGDPVKNYTSYEQGIQANLAALTNGRYGDVIAALMAGNNAMSVAQAIAASPWGTGSGVERVLSSQG